MYFFLKLFIIVGRNEFDVVHFEAHLALFERSGKPVNDGNDTEPFGKRIDYVYLERFERVCCEEERENVGCFVQEKETDRAKTSVKRW